MGGEEYDESMIRTRRSLVLFLFTISLLSFLFASTVSLLAMGGVGAHGHCPFMPGASSLCAMDAFAHIDAWQGFVRSLPLDGFSLILLALSVAFVVFARFSNGTDSGLFRVRYRSRDPAFAYAYITPLSEAFSNGILNPKPY